MLARRGVSDIKTVTTGPGNLAKALGIKRSFDGKRLGTPECMLNLAPPTEFQNPQIKRSNRIGVTLDLDEPMRFFAEWGQFPLDFRER